jgi:hypothetical protein
MQSPVPETYSETKWEVSRLTMHGAFKDNEALPQIEDPNNIITFLYHHFELAVFCGQNQDQPMQNAMCALASAPSSLVIEALNHFDPTQPLFVRGICQALQSTRPSSLREAALLFLPLLGDRWFHPCALVMGSTEMSSFCMDWASSVDSLHSTPTIQKAALTVFLGMINSPRWRSHIVPEKWTLLEYFTSVPGNLHPLQICINNPDLIDEVRNVDNPRAVVLWVEILWFKYEELIPKVREQLKMVTKEIAQNERGVHLGTSQSHINQYLLNTNSELRKVEALWQCALQSANPAATALEERVRMLQQALQVLDSIRMGRTT